MAATPHLRRRLAAALDSAGLLPPLIRLRERWIARRAPERPTSDDGLPIPPARLRVLVDGHADPDGFLEDSAAGAAMIREGVAAAGVAMDDLGAILDFGCGCGRTARHWARLSGPEVHGCDYNPELVAWCVENLPFMSVRTNELEPPAPYEDESFDLVYAISILTHMTEPLARAWIADLRRIVRPGGLLLVTTLGDGYRDRLTPGELERYDRGQPVVQRAGVEGTNMCAAYYPAEYVRGRLLDGFETVGDLAGVEFPQDVHVARKPA